MHLITRYNPDTNDYLKEIAEDDVLDLSERKYRIAFSIEDYNAPKHFKTDPEYV